MWETNDNKKAMNSIVSLPSILCRGVHRLNSTDPAFQYQTQKIIQKTVRVPCSLYTMDLATLNVYEEPTSTTRTRWNQMSDRAVPHIQSNSTASQGSFYHGSSIKRSQTRERPGATTPGGSGVDIKHNSYNRYLNRIKAPLARRGIIPPHYGTPIPFSCADPIYGSKTTKTAIVASRCGPPSCTKGAQDTEQTAYSLEFSLPKTTQEDLRIFFEFTKGQQVYARTKNTAPFRSAIVTNIIAPGTQYEVEFTDNHSLSIVYPLYKEIIPIFSTLCNKVPVQTLEKYKDACFIFNKLSTPDILKLLNIYNDQFNNRII